MNDLAIVDSQIHVWRASPSVERPSGSSVDRPHRPVPLGVDEVLARMDECHVRGAALVPVIWDEESCDLVIEAARRYPDRFTAVGTFELNRPDREVRLQELIARPEVRALRFTFHLPHERTWLTDGTADWLWPELDRRNVPVMVLPIGNVPRIAEIASTYPGLRIAIDHLALRRGTYDEEAFRDMDLLLGLARYRNVSVKVTCLPSYTRSRYPYRGLQRYVKDVVKAFGAERVFWGSDLSRLPCEYHELVDLFLNEFHFLSFAEKRAIMGEAFSAWIGWAPSALGQPFD